MNRCRVCRTEFHANDPDVTCCGSVYCRAETTWTPDDWSGQARLARARQRAAVDLNDLDRKALQRSP